MQFVKLPINKYILTALCALTLPVLPVDAQTQYAAGHEALEVFDPVSYTHLTLPTKA